MYTIYYYVYRIRYRMFCCRKMILRSLTGPVHRDPSEDVESDLRLQRLVQVLVDSMEFTADELESAPILQCILSRRPLSACLTLERP